jgi:tetratricopeptide (TPR) repeat protein
MTRRLTQFALLSLLVALPVFSARAQQKEPDKKAPDPTQESSSKAHQPDPATDPVDQLGDKASGNYDPYTAEKDVDIGMFYLHKGDVDAAIDRFKDATQSRPNWAKPRLLLGEAYEKKGDKSEALKYYKEYLVVFPNAPDAGKVRKKIEKLSQK